MSTFPAGGGFKIHYFPSALSILIFHCTCYLIVCQSTYFFFFWWGEWNENVCAVVHTQGIDNITSNICGVSARYQGLWDVMRSSAYLSTRVCVPLGARGKCTGAWRALRNRFPETQLPYEICADCPVSACGLPGYLWFSFPYHTFSILQKKIIFLTNLGFYYGVFPGGENTPGHS